MLCEYVDQTRSVSFRLDKITVIGPHFSVRAPQRFFLFFLFSLSCLLTTITSVCNALDYLHELQ